MTNSPKTSVIPEIAVPIAKCSQFLRAISVEPSAPANFRAVAIPTDERQTAAKIAASVSGRALQLYRF